MPGLEFSDSSSRLGSQSLSSILTALKIGSTTSTRAPRPSFGYHNVANSPGLIVSNTGTIAQVPTTIGPTGSTNLQSSSVVVSSDARLNSLPATISNTPFIIIIPQQNRAQSSPRPADQPTSQLLATDNIKTEIETTPLSTPMFILLDSAPIQSKTNSKGRISDTTTAEKNVLDILVELANPSPNSNQVKNVFNLASRTGVNAGVIMDVPSVAVDSGASSPFLDLHRSSTVLKRNRNLMTSGTNVVLPPFPGQEESNFNTNSDPASWFFHEKSRDLQNSIKSSLTSSNKAKVNFGEQSLFVSHRNFGENISSQNHKSIKSISNGNHLYSFIISGRDGVTRHEIGEISPGSRRTARTFLPEMLGATVGGVNSMMDDSGPLPGMLGATVGGVKSIMDDSDAFTSPGNDTFGLPADILHIFGNYT